MCPSAMQARFIELLHDMRKLVKASTGLSGAIYTQMADVESEVNGILTYDRKVLICSSHHLATFLLFLSLFVRTR